MSFLGMFLYLVLSVFSSFFICFPLQKFRERSGIVNSKFQRPTSVFQVPGCFSSKLHVRKFKFPSSMFTVPSSKIETPKSVFEVQGSKYVAEVFQNKYKTKVRRILGSDHHDMKA